MRLNAAPGREDTTVGAETSPLFPEIEVEIEEYADKPMACMAVVRRSLQRAGFGPDAARFTAEALASEPDRVLEVARRWVTVR